MEAGGGDGDGDRASGAQAGDGGCGRRQGGASVVQEVVEKSKRDGEELHRHRVGEESSGGEGGEVRGEQGMARVNIAPLS